MGQMKKRVALAAAVACLSVSTAMAAATTLTPDQIKTTFGTGAPMLTIMLMLLRHSSSV